MYKVLLVEDDQTVHPLVLQSTSTLADLNCVQSIKSAEEQLAKQHFDLAILAIDFPDGNGIDFCSSLQSRYPHLLIFFLTDHTSLSEKVLGFSAGADDYITKPFYPLELRARIESRLKKHLLHAIESDIEKWKELQICKSRQEIQILEDNKFQKIELTSIEYKILMYLSMHPSEVIARDRMLNDIWGENVHVYPRSVDTHISKIRKKLGSVAHVLKSIHGVGYKFQPSVYV